MLITIQATPKRLDYIRTAVRHLDNPVFHVDREGKNAFESFRDMLKYEVKDYRLHLQDDVVLAENLQGYLPQLARFMESKDIHVLTLFAPARKSLERQYLEGRRIVPYGNFVGNQAVIFSKRFVDLMREHIKVTRQTKDDDFFIQETADTYRIRIFAHLPVLVQHNIKLSSLLGHDKHRDQMISDLFDPHFLLHRELDRSPGIKRLAVVYEGWKNLLTSNPQVEALARERLAVCNACAFQSPFKFCGKCGCFTYAKARAAEAKCDLGYWDNIKS